MKGTIHELWNGRIPHTAMYDEKREEVENLRNLILLNRKELCTVLNEEQKSRNTRVLRDFFHAA